MQKKTKERLDRIRDLLKQGKPVAIACQEVGMSLEYYRRLKRSGNLPKAAIKKRKPELLTLSVPQVQAPLVILMGRPDDVNLALDRLSRVGVSV